MRILGIDPGTAIMGYGVIEADGNRYQLLDMLIIQTERADHLQKQLAAAQEKLDSREVEMTVMGSIAEASLHLGGVFEAAQNAADIYLNAAKERAAALEAEAARKAEQILQNAQWQAGQLLEQAELEARKITRDPEKEKRIFSLDEI